MLLRGCEGVGEPARSCAYWVYACSRSALRLCNKAALTLRSVPSAVSVGLVIGAEIWRPCLLLPTDCGARPGDDILSYGTLSPSSWDPPMLACRGRLFFLNSVDIRADRGRCGREAGAEEGAAEARRGGARCRSTRGRTAVPSGPDQAHSRSQPGQDRQSTRRLAQSCGAGWRQSCEGAEGTAATGGE